MASDAYKQMKSSGIETDDKRPKHKKLIQMLTFRVVPAYYQEIEKVANHKKMTVSKLIRTYIKEGMKRDGELSDKEVKDFGLDMD
jgi:hypothetical protein